MTASVLTVMSAIASKTITTGFFISASHYSVPANLTRLNSHRSKNELSLAKDRRGDTRQSRNVMLTIRMLETAIIIISEPSKLLKTRNIGTLTVPEHPFLW